MPKFIVGQTIQFFERSKISRFVHLINTIGMDHVEFDPTVFEDIEDLHQTCKLVQSKSVVIHAPYFTDWGFDLSSHLQKEKVETFIENMRKYGNSLGTNGIVVHPPIDPNGDEAYFLDVLSKLPFRLLLENLPGQEWSEFEIWYLRIKRLSSAQIEMCFDVPHSFLTNNLTNLFAIPPSILPDLHYIHISDLNHEDDCHWPFYTQGGQLPITLFHHFLKNVDFQGIINMEMRPEDSKGYINIVKSFLLLEKMGSLRRYLCKLLRILCVAPYLMYKLKKK